MPKLTRILSRLMALALLLTLSLCYNVQVLQASSPTLKLTGPRSVAASSGSVEGVVEIPVGTWLTVTDERYNTLPVFNPSTASWQKGVVLRGVNACECSVFGALDVDSVKVKRASDSAEMQRGKDYDFDNSSGAIGRLEGGSISATDAVLVSYRCAESRIDSIVVNDDNSVTLLQGEPRVLMPEPALLKSGQRRLATVMVSRETMNELNDEALFPIDSVFAEEENLLDASVYLENLSRLKVEGESEFAATSDYGAAKKFLPKTWAKLTSGQKIRILAWGDSVTACGFLPDSDRWQIKFVERLQKLFPDAEIELLTEAWGGRNSDTYRNEPPGSPKNYQEKVLDLHPDLIISEFVNDAFMTEEMVQIRYGQMLEDFQNIGAEWIIVGPHYVRPDWMQLTSQKGIDNDPRQLVAGLRTFSVNKSVPLAETPYMYGKLWRSGIPYLTLMTNNINHPNAFGMELFAAALERLFIVK
ncbi:MAG: hypothetical protein Q4G03_05770 [Planctomycetia bacterium]|nr:hypothetical protein [Planctomycetia bacterium]